MVGNSEQIVVEQVLGSLNEFERKNAPKLLNGLGDFSLLHRTYPRVSIVGTRKPTSEGMSFARNIVSQLLKENVVIVSGLAQGIDTVAHEAAISGGGRTIAVLGTPLDQCFPAENRKLQEQIGKQHLLISEFTLGSSVTKKNFPIRNRTMALVSHATIIIEAGEKSGTEHQGWEAIRLGRPLFISDLLLRQKHQWVSKLLHYGAQEVSSADISLVLEMIPVYMGDLQSSAVI